MYKFKKFLPPSFTLKEFNISLLKSETDKDWYLASNGRACLYYILNEYNVKTIMVPVYVCNSVLQPIQKLDINVIYYDIDKIDLNPSLVSIKENYLVSVDAILVPSMYGNPADLINIERFCSKNNILLIDDAAQSFGAKLDGKNIGTFGDAGFFSLSPGKPLAAHMGGIFRLNKLVTIEKKPANKIFNKVKLYDFNYNRLNIYKRNIIWGLGVTIVVRILERITNLYLKGLTKEDLDVIGGVLYRYFRKGFDFRQNYFNDFKIEFEFNENCRIISNVRGVANNHKIVLLLKNEEVASQFKKMLKDKNVYFINGYKLLTRDNRLKNANSIDGLVFELPIEENSVKMSYLKSLIKEFFKEYDNGIKN